MADPQASTAMAQPLQFGLRTMFVLTTGLGFGFGLLQWHPHIGGLLAILLVGTGWSAAALWARWNRLAYFLATVPMGAAAYLVLSVPISPLTFLALAYMGPWPHLGAVLVMCVASIMTGVILRRGIRRPAKRDRAFVAVKACYVGASLYVLALFVSAGVVEICTQRAELSEIFVALALGAVVAVFVAVLGGPIVATLSLHVAWPMAVAFVWILHRIDPIDRELTAKQRDICRTVEAIEAGPSGRIMFRDVCEALGQEPAVVEEHLSALQRYGVLRWSVRDGYRVQR